MMIIEVRIIESPRSVVTSNCYGSLGAELHQRVYYTVITKASI